MDDPAEAREARAGHRGEGLAVFAGSGPLPGVDLDDSAGLLDLMEGTVMMDASGGADTAGRADGESPGRGRPPRAGNS